MADQSSQPEPPPPQIEPPDVEPDVEPEAELEAELDVLESDDSAGDKGANNGGETEPEAPQVAPAPDEEPLIVFRDVSIAFGDHVVLQDVSFSVSRGQTLCILGRSGVGKSVSLRLLMGFLKPDSGSIRVAGQEITELDEDGLRAIRRRITMVFQNGALFDSLSVRENVAFPLREHESVLSDDQIDQLVERLIALVGAEDVIDALPASLSTGRKRAVAMARALAAQPEVVLYDEPTTMVDPLIARRLGNLIQRLKRQLGFTSVVVTHDMRFAERLADSVLFLDAGRASFFGPLDRFMASTDPSISQFLTLDRYVLPSV